MSKQKAIKPVKVSHLMSRREARDTAHRAAENLRIAAQWMEDIATGGKDGASGAVGNCCLHAIEAAGEGIRHASHLKNAMDEYAGTTNRKASK